MAIVKRGATNKLFGGNPTNPFQDRSELMKPRVHNRYHKTAPADAVYIGRGSPWGNPFVIGKHGTREEVIERFEREILPTLDVSSLRGKHLVCFCKPARCHGDAILRKANG